MAVYEYRCRTCDDLFELRRPMSESDAPAACPQGHADTVRLLSVFASAPYLHSGAAPTLDAVLENVTHRSAGSGGADMLTSAGDRQALVRFLKSIDRSTEPFTVVNRPANLCGPTPP